MAAGDDASSLPPPQLPLPLPPQLPLLLPPQLPLPLPPPSLVAEGAWDKFFAIGCVIALVGYQANNERLNK